MRNMFKKPHDIMLYKERTEFQEFGHAKKDYRECRSCGAIYYNKAWHHAGRLNLKSLKQVNKSWPAHCPACRMIQSRKYEGVLTIDNIPGRFQNELYHLIKAFSKRAYDKDCQHRLIAINKQGASTWMVTTTENQLANKLAQKIKDVFDKVEVKISYSEHPDDVERIRINFRPFLSLLPS